MNFSIFSAIPFVCSLMFVGACAEQTYTYRCSCTKIAYSATGEEIADESFNQTICDTTENIEASFTGELATTTQECAQYFDVADPSSIDRTDCTCDCELLGSCN